MSINAINWVMKVSCTPTQKLVLIVLANHANDEGYAFPSMDLLVKSTCLTDRAIRAAKSALIEAGFIKKTPEFCKGALRLLINERTEPRSAKPERHSEIKAEPYSGKAEPHSAQTERRSAPIYNHQLTTNNHHDLFEGEEERSLKHNLHDTKCPDRFDEFWSLYPRKVAKQAAFIEWKRITKRTLPEQIISGLKAFRFSQETQYQPHPRTWLHQRRWEDNAPAKSHDTPDDKAQTRFLNALQDWATRRSFGEKVGPKPELADFLDDRRIAA